MVSTPTAPSCPVAIVKGILLRMLLQISKEAIELYLETLDNDDKRTLLPAEGRPLTAECWKAM